MEQRYAGTIFNILNTILKVLYQLDILENTQ